MDKYIALAIDVPTNTEIILIGTHNDILSYINESNQDKVSVYKRELGSMLFELNTTSSNNVINSYLSSLDNYHNELDEPFINDSFIEVQRHLTLTAAKNPNIDEILDKSHNLTFHNNAGNIYYYGNSDYDFIITDISISGLVHYYLKILYRNNLYPRRCKHCNKPFIAKTHIFDVLCFGECKTIKNKEKIQRYKEKNDDCYEAKYMTIYQRWYTKIRRGKAKKIFNKDSLKQVQLVFDTMTSESYEKRTAARKGNITAEQFMQWLGNYDMQLNTLFNNLKTENKR